MSDHNWIKENIASYITGGLEPDERQRFEKHMRICGPCAKAVDEARRVEQKLDRLFSDVRPDAGLEERAIRTLWAASPTPALPRVWGSGGVGAWPIARHRRLAVAAAAVLFLAILGAGTSTMIMEGQLEFPGSNRVQAANDLKQLGLAAQSFHDASRASAAVQGMVVLDASSSMAAGDEPSGGWDANALARNTREEALSILGDNTASASSERQHSSLTGGLLTEPEKREIALDPNDSEKKEKTSEGRMGTGMLGGRISPSDDTDKLREQPAGSNKQPGGEYFKPGDVLSGPASTPPGPKGDAGGEPAKEKQNQEAAGSDKGKPENDLKNAQPDKKTEPAAPAPAGPRKIIIRSGEIEFEIESFDSAVAAITKLVNGIKGAYVDTVNSEKLPNGKVRGTVVVRVPPEHLDALVLDLRKELGKAGELKGQRIGSQDISKQYTDLESRLRAARAMEERLLQIIKSGKGEIKDLLAAEKELGVWRTKIEEYEGELRYYNNLVALSTLTITLAEREIRAPFAIIDTERVQMGLEVEDVLKAQQQALAAIGEAKGRVTKSELKQSAAGQLHAIIHFEAPPEAAGPLRDRLEQLGRRTRLDIDRLQHTEGGSGRPGEIKSKRNDTQFFLSLYNVANVAPREKVVAHLVTLDVPAGYRALQEAIQKANGRIINANLNEQNRANITAELEFEVRRGDEAAITEAMGKVGDVFSRNLVRSPESDNVTESKLGYKLSLINQAQIQPRQILTLGIEVSDVDRTAAELANLVRENKGRTVESHQAREPNGRVTAKLSYDVPFAAASGLIARFKHTGTVRAERSSGNPQVPETDLAVARIEVVLSNTELIVPKDDGLWPQVRKGLSKSFAAIAWSLTWLIFGICVVLPWVVVIYGIYRIVLRILRKPGPVTPAA